MSEKGLAPRETDRWGNRRHQSGERCPHCQGTSTWASGHGTLECRTCHLATTTAGNVYRLPLHIDYYVKGRYGGLEHKQRKPKQMRRLEAYETAAALLVKTVERKQARGGAVADLANETAYKVLAKLVKGDDGGNTLKPDTGR